MRLDKYLASMGLGTRSEIKKLINQKRVQVNGETIRKSDYKVQEGKDHIQLDGQSVHYQAHIYIMMNKPQGVITANKDDRHKTVMDLVGQAYGSREIHAVGRLDKDTEGLLILTNDGDFNHSIMSPKRHVKKTYYVEVDGPVDQNHIQAFANQLPIDKGDICQASDLEIIEAGDQGSRVYLTIQEGKYHQVKRMFMAFKLRVTFLKRVAIGGLALDPDLGLGDHRLLTQEEVDLIKG